MKSDRRDGSERQWEELREILTGEERRQIESIIKRLDDKKVRASDVAKILPEALRLSAKHGPRLNETLIPIIAGTISDSVKRNPSMLVDALYGLIGPATRKAVYESMKGMMQSFNDALQSVFTYEGIKWRIESIATGKSYAEIVLIRSVVYRVEQVFLIHKETALLLKDVKASQSVVLDEDMVSSMLRAIQDFVRDSFKLEGADALDEFNVGDMSVQIEDSPYAVLAAIVRGNAPDSVRKKMKEVLEKIHDDYYHSLKEFDGDTAAFEPAVAELEKCVVSKAKTEEPKTPVYAIVVVSIIALALAVGLFFQIWDTVKWSNYIEKLEEEPGVVVIEESKNIFDFSISGLVDPAASDPAELAEKWGVSPDRIDSRWRGFTSLEPDLIVKKAGKFFGSNDKVMLAFADGVLSATGTATGRSLQTAANKATSIPGVERFDYSKVKVSEGETLDGLIQGIEHTYFYFMKNTVILNSGQEGKIDKISEKIRLLNQYAQGKQITLEIRGHTDSSGSESRNEELSWNRAKKFLEILAENGLRDFDFILKGVGNKDKLVEEKTEEDMSKNRRVSLKVFVGDSGSNQ